MDEYQNSPSVMYALPGASAPLPHVLAMSALTGVLVFFLCKIIEKYVRF